MTAADRPLAEAAASALLRAINVVGGNPWLAPDPLLDYVFKALAASRPEPPQTLLMAAEVALHRYQRNIPKPPPRPDVEGFLGDLTDLCRTHGATIHWSATTVMMEGWAFDVALRDGRWQVESERCSPPTTEQQDV